MAFNKYGYKLNSTFINIEEIRKTAQDADKCYYYTIPLEYEFRPDLIAWFLYKDVSMADYLAIINDIDDIPGGFYRFRKLRVLDPELKYTVEK